MNKKHILGIFSLTAVASISLAVILNNEVKSIAKATETTYKITFNYKNRTLFDFNESTYDYDSNSYSTNYVQHSNKYDQDYLVEFYYSTHFIQVFEIHPEPEDYNVALIIANDNEDYSGPVIGNNTEIPSIKSIKSVCKSYANSFEEAANKLTSAIEFNIDETTWEHRELTVDKQQIENEAYYYFEYDLSSYKPDYFEICPSHSAGIGLVSLEIEYYCA